MMDYIDELDLIEDEWEEEEYDPEFEVATLDWNLFMEEDEAF